MPMIVRTIAAWLARMGVGVISFSLISDLFESITGRELDKQTLTLLNRLFGFAGEKVIQPVLNVVPYDGDENVRADARAENLSKQYDL